MCDKPKIIFDTDMDTDCDDMGALALLLKYAKKGDIELLGAVVDAPCLGGAAAVESLCKYNGFDLPIGTIYESDYAYENTERYHRYRDHRKTLPDSLYYNKSLSAALGKKDTDYPSALSTYQKILKDAPDHSVTIVAVGFMTALQELFDSPNGLALFERKVVKVVSMGCADYPETDNYNFNYNMDRTGAGVFFEKCPCPIVVSPDGEDVITGSTFTQKLPCDHPLRLAYEQYNGLNTGRSSWDLLAAYEACYPNNPFFKHEEHGTVYYDVSNNHVKWIDGKRRDSQIKLAITNEEMAVFLEKELVEE